MSSEVSFAGAPLGSVAFSGSALDRADAVRINPQAIAALITAPNGARMLRLDGFDPVVGDDGALVWDDVPGVARETEMIFLGIDADGRGAFVRLSPEVARLDGIPATALWAIMAGMDGMDLAAWGLARALTLWHARHRFCPSCGGTTQLARGGWQRNCEASGCGAQHFPRVDPVVIMTVEHGGDLLLARQPRFAPGRYTTLAGFLEPGECVEEAAAREIYEEVGLRVDQVRYVVSQPWPFPGSLMLGCHAVARSRDLVIDYGELEDARWFTRAEVAAAMARDEDAVFTAPPRHAVAWHLLARWLIPSL